MYLQLADNLRQLLLFQLGLLVDLLDQVGVLVVFQPASSKTLAILEVSKTLGLGMGFY